MPANSRQLSPPPPGPRPRPARKAGRTRRRLGPFAAPRSAGEWRTLIAVALTIVGGGCAVYLCFRSSGDLATVRWLPRPLAEWGNEHGRLRNFPAFFLLTCPAMVALPAGAARWQAAIALGAFGTLLELGERFVPGRWVEWQDLAWTWAGVAFAWLLFTSGTALATRFPLSRSLQRPAKSQLLR